METAKRILAIDGGGIKGVIPAAFLAAIERATGASVVDHFDLIVGTSTGGIIAIGLGLGLSAAEILAFYEKDGPSIFEQRSLTAGARIWRGFQRVLWTMRPRYEATSLRAALEKAFGDRVLGESRTRLVIPAFDRQRQHVHVFKTAHHPRFEIDWKVRAVDVALATTAAPTYFPGHRLENGLSLLDGGIWANNPVGLAVVEAIGVLHWPQDRLYVLSLGCSETPIRIPERAGVGNLALKAVDLLMVGQSRGSYGTAKLLTGHKVSAPRVYRYEHSGAERFTMTDARRIQDLKGVGEGMAREAMPQVGDIFFKGPRAPFVPFHAP